jgi:3'(2'), 5'-bisphosphate nucleotidase
MNLVEQLAEAKKCAIAAGRAIMQIYDSQKIQTVEMKAGDMPLTVADKASNSIIIEALSNAFPEYAILSEEEKDDTKRLDNDFCFIVDPLDGTKEFIKRNGQFTVNIALSYRHETVMGVIYVPVSKELYFATKGDGAFLIRNGEEPQRLQVSACTDVSALRVVMSNSHECQEMSDLLEKYQLRNFIKVGSSLKGCMVARGDAEIYYRYNPTMEWDTAAMQCIAEEAGAIFRQMDDSPMYYNRRNSLNEKGFYIINRSENRLR